MFQPSSAGTAQGTAPAPHNAAPSAAVQAMSASGQGPAQQPGTSASGAALGPRATQRTSTGVFDLTSPRSSGAAGSSEQHGSRCRSADSLPSATHFAEALPSPLMQTLQLGRKLPASPHWLCPNAACMSLFQRQKARQREVHQVTAEVQKGVDAGLSPYSQQLADQICRATPLLWLTHRLPQHLHLHLHGRSCTCQL